VELYSVIKYIPELQVFLPGLNLRDDTFFSAEVMERKIIAEV